VVTSSSHFRVTQHTLFCCSIYTRDTSSHRVFYYILNPSINSNLNSFTPLFIRFLSQFTFFSIFSYLFVYSFNLILLLHFFIYLFITFFYSHVPSWGMSYLTTCFFLLICVGSHSCSLSGSSLKTANSIQCFFVFYFYFFYYYLY